jgi:hypothetical protein
LVKQHAGEAGSSEQVRLDSEQVRLDSEQVRRTAIRAVQRAKEAG